MTQVPTQDPSQDPFAHLHDESYADAYEARRVGHESILHMGGRARISLNGPWHFTPDLFDEGLRQSWPAYPPTPSSEWDRPRDADLWRAETLAVPSCWTAARPEWRYFEGGAWYARIFDWSPDRAPRLMLRVGAASYEARVFLNGVFVASHRGGSTPFFAELTLHLREGENRLLIQVDNRRRADRVPMHHFDWFNHGGLFREVDLVPLPEAFIRRLTLALAEGGIEAKIMLSDARDGIAILDIAGLVASVQIPIAHGSGRMLIAAGPELWSPERPRLYEVHASFGEDRIADRVGFRSVAVRGEDILLNGEPLFLRGACVHEDDVTLGRVTSEEDIRRRFRHAKELGCNFLRLTHYPHHELVAEIADEEGLLLWEEIPVYWAIDFANPDTYADAENQLLELIARDANRASVILWGVGNENADTNARFMFMSRLAEAARHADPTRLIAAACLINRSTFRIEDRLAACLDVVGLNEYFGWYEPDFTGLERLLANSQPGKPVVISETGADALAGHHGRDTELFTEERQAAMLSRQLAIIRDVPYIRGFCAWLLYDFRSERRQTQFQKGFNRKGLIAEDKVTKKLAFAAVARAYQELA